MRSPPLGERVARGIAAGTEAMALLDEGFDGCRGFHRRSSSARSAGPGACSCFLTHDVDPPTRF